MIEIRDIDNNVIKCEVLFTFNNNDNNFIVYLDDKKNILASFYKKIDEDKIEIYPILEDKDFDIVDTEIKRRCD
jgi:hypothetical protein